MVIHTNEYGDTNYKNVQEGVARARRQNPETGKQGFKNLYLPGSNENSLYDLARGEEET